MSVEATHREYDFWLPQWQLMRDAVAGQEAIKDRAETYLPMPSGFKAMDDQGKAAYKNYITRAQFPEIAGPTVRGMNGVINRTEISIELPPQLEPLWENATKDGSTLETLYRRMTNELLQTGRLGILPDMPENANPNDIPYLALYTAETIINWSKDGDFFVLDESDQKRDGFNWNDHKKHRVLELKDAVYTVTVYDDGAAGSEVIPQASGGKKFDRVPFVVMGSTDVAIDVDEIPLKGVANAAVAIYQLSADYRWQLFMSGQETLVLTGVDKDDKPNVIGAGVVLTLKKDATAEYIGPSGQGIEAHRVAIQDERNAAAEAGAKLFQQEGGGQESGEARKLRFTAETASLASIALSAAQGLERALRFAARFVGADESQVIVTPNLDFIDSTLTPQEAFQLIQGWQAGGFSKEVLFNNLQKGEIIPADRTFEEEQAALEDEMPEVDDLLDNPPTNDELASRRAARRQQQKSGGKPEPKAKPKKAPVKLASKRR